MCFAPSELFPGLPDHFMLTNNFTVNHPNQLVGSTPAPWSIQVPSGIPFPFQIAFQGVILGVPTQLQVTNGVLLNTL